MYKNPFIYTDPETREEGRYIIHLDASYEIPKEDENIRLQEMIRVVSQVVLDSHRDAQLLVLYVDVDGYKLKNASKEFILKIVQTVQMLYPNALYRCHICNMKPLFKYLYDFVYNWLDDVTRNKLMFKTVPDLKNIREKHTLKYPNLYKIMYPNENLNDRITNNTEECDNKGDTPLALSLG